ncbi:hypothetical protein [Actinomadura sp. DC4]|nr:hypothetical protein [Actinomadura sp. DC4]MDN3354060.1 hypothetical protein [Actinomadura sp. DC4]
MAEIEPYVEAGFDEVALMEIGGDAQDDFIGWAEREPLPALRSL